MLELEMLEAVPPTTNGLHMNPPRTPISPLADSPDTPINTVPDLAMKNYIGCHRRRSGERRTWRRTPRALPDQSRQGRRVHDWGSGRSQSVFSLVFLSSFSSSFLLSLEDSISPPHGTPPPPAAPFLRDVSMAEEDPQSQTENHQHEDIEMGDAEPLKPSFDGPSEADEPPPTQSTSGTPGSAVGGSSSITAVDSVHVRDVSPNEDDAPPAGEKIL
jgi:hypothetical protein